eukprot:255633_1
MVDSEALSVTITITVVIYAILLPFCILCTMRTKRVAETLIMKKRHVNGSIWFCYFGSAWLFLSTALGFWISLYYEQYEANTIYKILKAACIIIYPYACQGGVYCLLYRFWMIYFKFIYAESLKNEKWKIQINPQGISSKEQWIITHRKDYGNTRWVVKRLFMVYFSVATLSAICFCLGVFDVIDYSLWEALDSILFITPLILLFVLWFKMPAFSD